MKFYFGLKHPKITTSEWGGEVGEVVNALVLASVYPFPELPFCFLELPFCSPEVPFYFLKMLYRFPELPFSFPEKPFYYSVLANLHTTTYKNKIKG